MSAKLRRQRGVAIITALLLTTLSVTIVASLFWMQQVQVRSMENQRLHLQTKWILRGALDYARLILRQDGIDNQAYTSLAAVWNTPLAETRLDQYIERERVEGEVFNASLSGRILDAQARFNLTNLAEGQVISQNDVKIYDRLLRNLGLDPALAKRTADAVKASGIPGATPVGQSPPPAPSSIPWRLTQLDDLLAIPGYNIESVAKLREFAIVLPEKTKVNVNTAPAEVLAAIIDGYSVSDGNALVARRKTAYFRNVSDFTGQIFGQGTPIPDSFQITSEHFLVVSKVRLDRAALDAEALVKRSLQPPLFKTETVWVRQN